jgi:hypothetical protein
VRLAAEQAAACGVAIAGRGYLLDPRSLEVVEAILRHCPDVGMITGWLPAGGKATVPACPAFPYQWVRNEAGPLVVFRRRALLEAGGARPELHEPYATWDLVNAVMAAGWKGVTAPIFLGSREPAGDSPAAREERGDASLQRLEMRRLIRSRFPDLVARDAQALVALLEGGLELDARDADAGPEGRPSPEPPIRWSTPHAGAASTPPDRWTNLSPRMALRLPLRAKLSLAASALRDLPRTVAWLRTHARRVMADRSANGRKQP